MKIGQLITSFLQGKVNPIMTSTIFNHYAEAATVENKTGYYKELHGGTNGSPNQRGRGKGKGAWLRLLLVFNDLLPNQIRPIKSKRGRRPVAYGWRSEIYTFKMVWRSHHKPRLLKAIKRKLIK